MTGSTAPSVGILLAALGCIVATQPRLAAIAHSAKEKEDVYALPPPAPLHVAVLGWDAAAVDLIWATLLVEYGTHWSEHRDFTDVPRYIDAILELEPTYWPVYRYADTMLAYRPMQGTEDDVRRARAYLERGTKERPTDSRVWLEYGQFLAYIGPSFLHDSRQRDAWRRDGALALGRAADLGGGAETSLSAATILARSGDRDQAIGYLRRAYVFTQHPAMADVHEAIRRRLVALEASAWNDAADAAKSAVDARWKREMPFVGRGYYLLLGPGMNPYRCEGLDVVDDPECSRDWSAIVGETITGPGSSEGSP